MVKPFRVWENVYMVGDAQLSHPYDCCVYLLDAGELVLIDAGAGRSFDKLVSNIESLGFDPKRIKAVLVTHAHIDHIGALKQFRDTFRAQVIAHELDAGAIEGKGWVGAELYGVNYAPCPVDLKIREDEASLKLGDGEIKLVHIPGHTPGSLAACVDIDKKRVLFGQDIHGPYLPEWGADPEKAKSSLQKLLALKADILCEGHFGIYQPAEAVERYIRGYVKSL